MLPVVFIEEVDEARGTGRLVGGEALVDFGAATLAGEVHFNVGVTHQRREISILQQNIFQNQHLRC